MTTFQSLGTVPTPTDLGPNAIPHDVVLDPDGSAAYVSIAGTNRPAADAVVKYTTAAGFGETDRADVGKDPHLGLTASNNLLYAPVSGSDRMDVLSRGTLDPALNTSRPPLTIDNAHGITFTNDGETLYITTFPGTGEDGLHVIDPETNTLIDSVLTQLNPHNVITSTDDARLYITHSGATSTRVTVYDITGANRDSPAFLTQLTVGANPFGLIAVPAVPEPAIGGIVAAAAMLLGAMRLRR
jgi:DNA-binding beta-propeller fold protein YncE